MFNVLIVGYGNIGKRYHEAILKTKLKINLFVKEKNKIPKSVNSINKFKGKFFDLVIISTCADQRISEVRKINKNFFVNFWILEKNISQSEKQLTQLYKEFNNLDNVSIGTSYKTMKCFKKYKNILNRKIFSQIRVTGEEMGLFCNAVHFIDTYSWILGEKVKKIDTSKIYKKWYESKRKSFYDTYGSLSIKFEKTVLSLISTPKKGKKLKEIIHNIKGKNFNLKFYHDSDNGLLNINGKKTKLGKIEPLSINMIKNIKSILKNKKSELPRLNKVYYSHLLFLKETNAHWKRYGNLKLRKIAPIT